MRFQIPTLVGFSLLAASCASAQPANDTPQIAAPKATQLVVKKGQYLSIIMPDAKTSDAATKARNKYYASAFPLGAKFGLKREAALSITQNIISDYKPSSVLFFSYPSKQAEASLANHSDWPAIKASRPQIWNQLNIFSAEIREDIALTFDPTKSYTLVVAWKKDDDKTNGYDKYLKGIEPAVARFGGRFVYKMRNPQMESHTAIAGAPAQLTFVEWDSVDGFSKVRASAEYKAAVPDFQAGVKKIEFYRMTTPR